MDKKSNESFLHLLVNDFEAAKNQLNKSFGGIRIKPRARVPVEQDQDVSVDGSVQNSAQNSVKAGTSRVVNLDEQSARKSVTSQKNSASAHGLYKDKSVE